MAEPENKSNGVRLSRKVGRATLASFATLYFFVDAVFWFVVWPVRAALRLLPPLPRVAAWIRSLSPWTSLALFIVPLAILEPVKPIGAYWMATGHFKKGILLIVAGEIVKLTLVERLFQLTRDKLLQIRAFAWCYDHVETIRARLKTTTAWQVTSGLFRNVRNRARDAVLMIRRAFAG